MRYIFFDTETAGVPKDYNGLMSDLDNWPRVIQLAWVVAGDDGVELFIGVHLIKPDGWGFKFPKLVELHRELFGEGFDVAHDALVDVRDCKRSFFELMRRGLM